MPAILGLVGVGLFFLAYDAVDKSGARMAFFGFLALICFGFSIFGTPKHIGSGSGCFIDWDGFSNSEVCD